VFFLLTPSLSPAHSEDRPINTNSKFLAPSQNQMPSLTPSEWLAQLPPEKQEDYVEMLAYLENQWQAAEEQNPEAPITEAEADALDAAFTAQVLGEESRAKQAAIELIQKLAAGVERLEAERSRLLESRGEAYVKDLVQRERFGLTAKDLGMILEYIEIKGELCPRILFNGKVYLIVSKEVRASRELRKVIAKINMRSGAGRAVLDENGQQKYVFGFKKEVTIGEKTRTIGVRQTTSGRDLFVITRESGIYDEHMTPHAKPPLTSPEWAVKYARAIAEKPNWNTSSMALVTGFGLQAILTIIGGTAKSVLHGMDFNWLAPFYNGGFGLVTGVFLATMLNWQGSKDVYKARRLAKSMAISLPHMSALFLILYPGTWSESFEAFTFERGTGIFLTAFVSQYVKDYWLNPWRARTESGENIGKIVFKVPGLEKPIEWERKQLEHQLYYLINWSISLATVMSMVIPAVKDFLTIPGTDITVPILMFVGVPIAKLWSKNTARKLADHAAHDPDKKMYAEKAEKFAQEQERAWESSLVVRGANQLIRGVKGVGNACRRAFEHVYEDMTGRPLNSERK
jgi:hypothetical protein